MILRDFQGFFSGFFFDMHPVSDVFWIFLSWCYHRTNCFSRHSTLLQLVKPTADYCEFTVWMWSCQGKGVWTMLPQSTTYPHEKYSEAGLCVIMPIENLRSIVRKGRSIWRGQEEKQVVSDHIILDSSQKGRTDNHK